MPTSAGPPTRRAGSTESRRGSGQVGTEEGRGGARRRPGRDETFAAAVELASRGSSFRRFARRFSLCAADADDAYQRSLEILLTKAPTADRGELRAWLHTVIKHEALALRRQRERSLGSSDPSLVLEAAGEFAPALDEQASGRERVRQAAEALAHLKAAEIRCLLLKALGYSYDEIAERTGYSWTKVNRSLTEGRRRLRERFGEIASGARCPEFESLLSAACDGEATASQDRRLQLHLSRCGSCRAALRDYRRAPARLAELLPPGMLLPALQQGGWWSRLTELVSTAGGDRAGAAAWKLQQGAEALGAQKAAAVVASTAAIAGGAAVQGQDVRLPLDRQALAADARAAESEPPAQQGQSPAAPAPTPAEPPSTQPEPEQPPAPERPLDASQASAAGEFTPEAAVPEAATVKAARVAAAPSHAATAGAGKEFGP
jgi:RNA polymerase sigma factor (sigma-70 family)